MPSTGMEPGFVSWVTNHTGLIAPPFYR